MAKIYISSTYTDLRDYREAAYRTLRRMGHDVIAMEDYVATDNRPVDKCLLDVGDSDIYVGIVAWHYGYIPPMHNPNHRSITELEYRHALKTGIPCLIFLLDEQAPWSPQWMDPMTGEGGTGREIRELRSQLSNSFAVGIFQSPDELATQVGVAVHHALAQRESVPSHAQLHVFLCHASQDKPTVRELYKRLQEDEFDPWLDEEKILPGQDWQREINSALHKSDAVLVCLSQASTTKIGFVQKEIKDVLDLAELQPEGAIFIIPLRLDECDVPDRLKPWQWVNYFGDGGYERLRRSLEERIRQITPKSR